MGRRFPKGASFPKCHVPRRNNRHQLFPKVLNPRRRSPGVRFFRTILTKKFLSFDFRRRHNLGSHSSPFSTSTRGSVAMTLLFRCGCTFVCSLLWLAGLG